MSRNPVVEAAADTLNAIAALRLKSHRLEGSSEGVIIQQPGKPDLLLTFDAARRFAQKIEEAE